MLKDFNHLRLLPTLMERFEYLKQNSVIGEETFGLDRYLNQIFYKTPEWQAARREVIIRDDAHDLAHPDYEIQGIIYVHHMNPITIKQVLDRDPIILDPRYLISCSELVHKAIHFGDPALMILLPQERRPNDTSPWKK